MLADFANCLVTGWLWWALEKDTFGSKDKQRTSSGNNSGDKNNSASVPLVGDMITTTDLEALATNGSRTLFLDAVTTACVKRCLFSTDSVMRGVGPLDIRPGDMVCVIYGTAVPFVIRRCEDKKGYKLVGECYVYDLMHGKAIKDGRYEEAWIELV